jgi:peptidoglycan/xylan/chitin deacetylase (PgdA/CDA1 family)
MIEILMFHRVVPKKQINNSDAYFIRGTLVSKERLESILFRYLKEEYTFKTIEKLDFNSEENQVSLTFDDGYLDNYLYALPILEKHNIKATFYPIIGYCKEQEVAPLDYYYHFTNKKVANKDKKEWISGEIKKGFLSLTINEQSNFVNGLFKEKTRTDVAYMKTKELQELQALGHEIGGHSYYHDIYTNLSNEEILKDIQKTKKAFASIGISIQSYAYTDGQYNLAVIESLKHESIHLACAIKAQKVIEESNYELERKFITENDII